MVRALVASLCGTLTLLSAPQSASSDTERLDLLVLDIDTGKVGPYASTPLPGHGYCGSPDWSADGRHVVLDATPGREFVKSHIVAGDFPLAADSKFVDLGPGNCPTWSPDGKQILFRLLGGAVPGEAAGLWTMNADGTGRKHLARGNRPAWSPDGKRVLSATFSNPCQLKLIDATSGAEQDIKFDGYEVLSVPAWAGDGQTVVAVVRVATALSIALIDVTDPASAKVKQVLWNRGRGVLVEPSYPVYSAVKKRCVFVGRSSPGYALYSLDAAPEALPKRLEPTFFDKRIAGLALSPDGRYLLFGSERTLDGPQP